MAVAQPYFFFIRRETDTMAGISVSSHRTSLPAFYSYTREPFTRNEVSRFKTKKAVNGNICDRLFAIDSKRPHKVCKGAYFTSDRMRFGIRDVKPWTCNVIEVHGFSRRGVNSIMRTFMHLYLLYDVAVVAIDHIPKFFFQRRQVH